MTLLALKALAFWFGLGFGTGAALVALLYFSGKEEGSKKP